MISGYFLVNSKTNGKKLTGKIFNLLVQICFYSITFYFIAVKFHWITPNANDLQQAIFPYLNNVWWFATSYLIFYFLFPFLNITIKALNAKQHFALILILVIPFCVLSLYYNDFISGSTASNIILFVIYYLIGSYFRLYTIKNAKFERNLGRIIFLVSFILVTIGCLTFNYLAYKYNTQFSSYADNIIQAYSIFTILIGTSFIIVAKYWKIKPNHFINTIASTTFGIYLIHDHPFIRNQLWTNWFKIPKYFDVNHIWHTIGYLLFSTLVIFVLASLIEYLRIIFFKFIAIGFKKIKPQKKVG